MKLKNIVNGITVLEWHADPETEIIGIEADSRRVNRGFLFVAVKGYESDGHRYIPSAMENGAVCALCTDRPDKEIPYVLIENTRKGLALAAANFYGRPADKMKIIGVTGTNGKTTTTNLIKTILERSCGAKVGLIGTNGNKIGDVELPTERTTPESHELQALFSQMYKMGCTHVVMEVSSHALFLDRVFGFRFAVGVFTNLTEDHLDFHETMDNYADAKAILFSRCDFAAVNIDDEYSSVMLKAAECPVLKFSVKEVNAEMTASSVMLSDSGVSFDLRYQGRCLKAELGIPGEFSVYNALSALSASVLLGIPIERAVNELKVCSGVMGRAEVVPVDKDYSVIIDYAHTPDALENIIKTVRGYARGRVITLFGCGGDRDRKKRPIMGKIASDYSDFVIVTSDNPRTEEPGAIIQDILVGLEGTKTPYIVIENRKDAIRWALLNGLKDDVIILAGKGHETYQIVGKQKYHFDEREVIAEILDEI